MKKISNGWISEIREDGNGQIYLCAFSTVQVYSLSQKKIIKRIGAGNSFQRVAVDDNAGLLAIKDLNERVYVYNLKNENLLFSQRLKNQASGGAEMLFSPDGKYIVSGNWDGDFYLLDLDNSTIEVVYRFPESISNIQKYSEDEFLIYVNNHGIYKWKYPFYSNKIECISLNKINQIQGIDIEFGFYVIVYCQSKNVFAVNIDKTIDVTQTERHLGIINHDFSRLIETGFIIKKNLMTQFRIFWSKSGDYLALLDTFGKINTVYIIRYNDMKLLHSYYFVQPGYAHFVDDHCVIVSSYHDGTFIIDLDKEIM